MWQYNNGSTDHANIGIFPSIKGNGNVHTHKWTEFTIMHKVHHNFEIKNDNWSNEEHQFSFA